MTLLKKNKVFHQVITKIYIFEKKVNMEEKEKMNILGLIGLILGILAAVISFIPCLGIYAVFPGFIGIILSSIGLRKVKKGLAIAGLICSVIGTGVASWQIYEINQVSPELEKELKELENLDNDLKDTDTINAL